MSQSTEITDKNKFQEVASKWDVAHRYSPAPRHRRKIIMHLLKQLKFSDCLDAGCAQPYLLQQIVQHFSVKGYGCDISTQVVKENKEKMPQCEFNVLNLEKETWPGQKQFDLVVSSEVIEHIPDWKLAVKNIADMSKRYILITVPSGKVRPIDKKVGHYRHFEGPELVAALQQNGFTCLRIMKHGFPVHSLYKRLINTLAPDKMYDAFQSCKEYSFLKKIISHALYFFFYINYVFSGGGQLFILAERK